MNCSRASLFPSGGGFRTLRSINEHVKRTCLIQQGQKRDASGNLPNDGLNLPDDLLVILDGCGSGGGIVGIVDMDVKGPSFEDALGGDGGEDDDDPA